MKINWSAVLTGFVVTLALGFISGLIYTGSTATGVLSYWGSANAQRPSSPKSERGCTTTRGSSTKA